MCILRSLCYKVTLILDIKSFTEFTKPSLLTYRYNEVKVLQNWSQTMPDYDGSLEKLARESDCLKQAYGHFFDLTIGEPSP